MPDKETQAPLLPKMNIFEYYLEGVFYVWDITHALKIIERTSREVMWLDLQEQGITIERIRGQYPDIDETRLPVVDMVKPLIFVPMRGECHLIDGWHRLYNAALVGMKEMPGYLLTQEESDDCLIFKGSRETYLGLRPAQKGDSDKWPPAPATL